MGQPESPLQLKQPQVRLQTTIYNNINSKKDQCIGVFVNIKKIVYIGFLGNIFEWYDFSVYAFLAPVIGKVFFSSSDPKISLLKTFFIFSLSFLIRPLGSIFFGSLGDRVGRAYSLKISLFLMGIPTVLIGLLPTYNSIGIISVILLIILRLIQGFAAGGELPGSACYVYETSDLKNRSFFCSFIAASAMLGVLCGSLVATTAFFIFDDRQMTDFAWRIPFLLGSAILVFLYYVRNQLMDECFVKKEVAPVTKLIKNEYKAVLKIIILYAFVQTSFYPLFVWLPSYLNVYLGFSSKTAFSLGSIGMALLVIFTLLWGYVAKRIGRKKMILFSIISIMLLAYPAFVVFNHKSLPMILAALFMLALCKGCMDSVMVELMGDSFTSSVRCSGISISFTLAAALFGGTTPTICGYLINKTGYLFSPVILLIVVGILALPVALSLKE